MQKATGKRKKIKKNEAWECGKTAKKGRISSSFFLVKCVKMWRHRKCGKCVIISSEWDSVSVEKIVKQILWKTSKRIFIKDIRLHGFVGCFLSTSIRYLFQGFSESLTQLFRFYYANFSSIKQKTICPVSLYGRKSETQPLFPLL